MLFCSINYSFFNHSFSSTINFFSPNILSLQAKHVVGWPMGHSLLILGVDHYFLFSFFSKLRSTHGKLYWYSTRVNEWVYSWLD